MLQQITVQNQRTVHRAAPSHTRHLPNEERITKGSSVTRGMTGAASNDQRDVWEQFNS